MTIAVTADMVMDTHQREKTEKNVEQRMAHKIRTDYKEEIELKFVSFEQFLTKKGEKNEIAKAFLFRRFMTIVLVRPAEQRNRSIYGRLIQKNIKDYFYL